MPVSVLLADNSEIVRRAIRELLQNYAQIKLVGEAANFAQMVQIAKRLKPDVIVVDLNMLDRAPSDFRSQPSIAECQLIALSFAFDVDAKLMAASLDISLLLDKSKLSTELVPAILKTSSPTTRAGNSAERRE